ncbi:ATP-binding protein [Chitinophaga defluvii]|uniref:ATP-binding protein n=1 Tax=Chitinophaga defluvii TaxID=3163343 RepID=A0ABV2T404_9BACT
MEKMQNSPFKFLDPYAKGDSEIFFGREEETETLYHYVNKNRLVLVYGTSGTGKTSLVQCGLANRLEVTDWIPFFIRRGKDINTALRDTLLHSNAITPAQYTDLSDEGVIKILQQINVHYLRPVYLIFDQFEELLILGKQEEKEEFMRLLRRIFLGADTQFCNLLFILREEYFAWMDPFEQVIPGFSDRRLRVEAMRANDVEEVIEKSCKAFNIELEDPAANARQIITILSGKSTISLPYLQVYLDQLWREVFRETYPGGYTGNGHPYIKFTTEKIESFGQIKDVLQRFLTERKGTIQKALKAAFPDTPEDFTGKVLDAFVTDEGTKLPVAYSIQQETIMIGNNAPEYLQQSPVYMLHSCLKELENSKILRSDGTCFELAHDVLAALIDNLRSAEQRRVNEIKHQIRSRFEEFRHTHEFLTQKELDAYYEYIDKLNLEPVLASFFTQSAQVRTQENNDKIKEAKKLEEERIKVAKQKTARKWIIGLSVSLLIGLVLLFIKERKTTRQFNRYIGMFFTAYPMKDIDQVDALNLFEYIRKRVYPQDTPLLDQQMLQIMQSQPIQGKFALFTHVLPYKSLDASSVEISPDGRYILVDKYSRDSSSNPVHDYMLLDSTGKLVREFTRINYAYFTNGDNILLLSRLDSLQADKKVMKNNAYFTDAPNRFMLYDCNQRKGNVITLGAKGRFLYPVKQIVKTRDTEFDSHRVRFTAGGNILVPYITAGPEDSIRGHIKVIRPGAPEIEVPGDMTVSLSKDGKKFMSGHIVEGNYVLDIYEESGKYLYSLENASFGDFTTTGDVLYCRDNRLKLKSNELPLLAMVNIVNYAYSDDKRLLVEAIDRDTYRYYLLWMDEHRKSRQLYDEELLAVSFKNDAFVTRSSRLDTLDTPGIRDTIWRRRLSDFSPLFYVHPDGIDKVMYNNEQDNVLVLTKSNRLLLLDKAMTVKAGLQLTANDIFGFAKDGKKFFYARDEFLSVFRNNTSLINVFDAAMVKDLLAQKSSPIKREISKEEARDKLNLDFK